MGESEEWEIIGITIPRERVRERGKGWVLMLLSEDAFYESKDITGVSFKYCVRCRYVNNLVNINYNY